MRVPGAGSLRSRPTPFPGGAVILFAERPYPFRGAQ